MKRSMPTVAALIMLFALIVVSGCQAVPTTSSLSKTEVTFFDGEKGQHVDPSKTAAAAGLTCEARPTKEKVLFNAAVQIRVNMTNGSAKPIDLIATAEERGGVPGRHHPCTTLSITRPDGRPFYLSGDSAKTNPKAVRIEPGKSWSFELPVDVSHRAGDLPSLDALLPGTYTAEVSYSVGQEEKDRLGADTVYGEQNGALAGKKPERLWEGRVRSEPVKFEVMADDSKQLAILRAVYAGDDGKDLKLELVNLADGGGMYLQLRAKNTGAKIIYMGSIYGLAIVGPDGRTWEDFNGLRRVSPLAIDPGRDVDVTGWHFGQQAPGKYVVKVMYLTPTEKLVAESNSVVFVVAATPAK